MQTHRRRAAAPRVRPAVVLLVVGVLLALGVPAVWMLTHRDPALAAIDPGVAVALADGSADPTAAAGAPAVGSTPSPSTDSAPATDSAESAARPRPMTGTAARTSATTPRPTRTATSIAPKGTTESTTHLPMSPSVWPVPPAIPARLAIPAIDVSAPVTPVGVDDQGDMVIPAQVQQLGWYRYGSAPGSAEGSVVLSGHVDSADQGLGAFAALGKVHAGDRVVLTATDGRQFRYRVVGREAFPKTAVPLPQLFSRSGSPRLTLITCGGGFDSAAKSYLDNIVVTAVPA